MHKGALRNTEGDNQYIKLPFFSPHFRKIFGVSKLPILVKHWLIVCIL